ncbi:hypothetical protein P153DRAFT_358212 [Dothidotthia symphoricarpi CBS 119687]|uniref:Uncharacterized protein n=1 Tax=Dothidotthia symphoricarpi CBS 119687 TaxID=1392245 RepID=A0A6A6A8B7_9PLEO|nr:uncharacterized protein P153DRAFT_358212 [Dothidotthia symphoricarpi CBS 119687]KAF2128080.1 hypothetical protein P153DRAFT_358212 [Dothidotthia symphoricarpi CBS 119687]
MSSRFISQRSKKIVTGSRISTPDTRSIAVPQYLHQVSNTQPHQIAPPLVVARRRHAFEPQETLAPRNLHSGRGIIKRKRQTGYQALTFNLHEEYLQHMLPKHVRRQAANKLTIHEIDTAGNQHYIESCIWFKSSEDCARGNISPVDNTPTPNNRTSPKPSIIITL